MMQCPQCGTSNRLGAIFCRSCGAKLELDSVTSETFEKVTGVVPKNKSDAKKRTKRIIVNAIRLVILALLVLGVYLALQIPEVEKPKTDDRAATLFERKVESLTSALSGNPSGHEELKITEEEINSYIQARLAATDLGKGTFKLVDTWVLFDSEGEVTWVIDAKLFGRPLRFQYLGKAEVADGKLVFSKKGLFTGKLGKLPYPTILIDMTTKRLLSSLLEGDKTTEGKIKKLLDGVSELTFGDGEVTVKVRRGSGKL
jgi:hypothetical protein